ncbi:polysaccharide biosynthesis tyrosine autokinase [Paraburkholderia sediminicola]|uniref:polysaccharide biosynthesis tyrosine autokinase n=1 Tax=Paraburkholderia sediminicola TaxID=458836 RepID=UPI0038B99A8C
MLRGNEDQLRAFMQPEAPTDEGLGDYLTILWDNRWIVATVMLTVLALGTLYAFLAPPTYRSDFAIQIEQPSPAGTSAQTLLGENLSGFLGVTSQATTEIEILNSRLVLGQTVDDLRLHITAEPRRFPVLGRLVAKSSTVGKPWFGLRRFAWGGESIRVDVFDVPPTLYDEKWTLTAGTDKTYQLSFDGQKVLDGVVGQLVSAIASFGTISLKVDQLVGEPGTQFVLVRHERLATIDELSKSLVIAERSKDSGVIGVTLEGKDPTQVARVLNRMATIDLRQNADRKAAEAQNMIAFLEGQLPSIKSQLEASEQAYSEFRRKRNVLDLGEEAKLLLKQAVDSQAQLADLEQRRAALMSRFMSNAPDVNALDAQISSLKDTITSSNGRIKGLPDNEQVAVGLMRDVQVNTQIYTNLVNNLEQLRVVKAGKIGSVRIVDYAPTPYFPVKPMKALVIVLSAVIGLLLGVCAAFAHRGMFSGVEDPDVIESQLGLSVYSTIPHSRKESSLTSILRKDTHDRCLAYANTSDSAIESIRSLTTALHFAMLGSQNKQIMIAGAAPGVGKSFVAANMSAILGSMNKRVLLVDADLRRGYLHESFGVSREGGLSDVISGQIGLAQAIHKNVGPGLDFLSTGAIPPSPAELLLHPTFERTLADLNEIYDIIIIDTPPVLAVTDAAIVGRLVGVALLVVRFGVHPIKEIETAVKRLAQAGVNLKGVVLNDIPIAKGRLRYGRYKYSYHYDYEDKR